MNAAIDVPDKTDCARAVMSELYRRAEPEMRAERIGRNQPCPCKSGMKYKHCCLRKYPISNSQ